MRRRSEEAWDRFGTKIPQTLRRALKLHCVHAGMSVQDFVARALREKLDREGRRGRRR